MINIALTPTTFMIIQSFVEAAILRGFREIEGKSEEELKEMLEKQRERNKGLMDEIEAH